MGTRSKRKRKTLTAPSPSWRRRRREEDQHGAERRDWASLSRDVLRIVLGKLRQADILRGVGLVCSHWRRLALHEPLLWRHIDLPYGDTTGWHEIGLRERRRPPAGWKTMARAAVDRSAGRCESFAGHVDADVLVHLANRAPLLRSLNVGKWPDLISDDDYGGDDDTDTGLITDIIKKLPILERLVILSGYFEEELLEALLDHCPRLELLDVYGCRPMFRVREEHIAARIQGSTIKDLRLPEAQLF